MRSSYPYFRVCLKMSARWHKGSLTQFSMKPESEHWVTSRSGKPWSPFRFKLPGQIRRELVIP